MPLKLSLKPGEKFVINGAVIVNGNRRTNFIVQNRANILRDKDIMHQDDAKTPAARIYFPIMMMYLDPERSHIYQDEFVQRLADMMDVATQTEVLKTCVTISKNVMNGNYYKALVSCRVLLDYERERLQHVPGGVSEDHSADR